ncbi:putative toxin-antitoxin system toxin component, PIN family [Rhodoferax mekongensis]|uniref:putative toxin-antitoxin system toxin component, PIN family n=1 Tax=Rhodoferax mekongensis TaxID=3068341 RepID=UPI0028BE394A|nr:putative toxin-antitoxin system toxin component, PIN family [Rhodoferax sp. TBRC 17199]MDT7514163.1 putative toxin-antitoxin system toxin component, PIN family [Rhodoferax sp. TBRC 17199]
MTEPVPGIVLDTNIVLDVLVFKDPLTLPLRQALEAGQLRWLSTDAMREELARVLSYPQIAKRLAFYGLEPHEVLAARDAWVHTVDPAPKAPVTCKDPDDQRFIDLAVAHQCLVLSKDHAVLCMAKRLLALGASARAAIF